ncbi:MAG: hypothetical protein AAF791_08870 [Bacteroidota bacterium]
MSALLSSSFSFSEPVLLFPRAVLHEDRIELVGWQWRGRYRLRIPLGAVLRADVTPTGRLVLWLQTGEALRLRVPDALAWQQAIEPRTSPYLLP